MRIEESSSYDVFLEVRSARGASAEGPGEPTRFRLVLHDDWGHDGEGTCTLDGARHIGPDQCWSDFLDAYVTGGVAHGDLEVFGADLFRWLFQESGLAETWAGIAGAALRRPIRLSLGLGDGTEAFAQLPIELLRDAQEHLFARPGAGLVRSLLSTEARRFELAPAARVLLAWACPSGAGAPFDPAPHVDALRTVFSESDVEELPRASAGALEERLREAYGRGGPFDYLHLVAHGYRDEHAAGVCLHNAAGELDFVDAGRLARAVVGTGLRLAFLCSCKSAVASARLGDAFTGVAQRLLAQKGGDLPLVVATQANLPIKGSAELAQDFYQRLQHSAHPAEALAQARWLAAKGGRAWSVPILLARPEPRGAYKACAEIAADIAGLPRRYALYQDRCPTEAEALVALRESRLVSIVGLPGIGKTELGREVTRHASGEGLVDHVLYFEANVSLTTSLLRTSIGLALGHTEAPPNDRALAVVLNRAASRILLVIDNAEDLMREPVAHEAFRDQLGTLLDGASRLRVLLTTRWKLGSDGVPERAVHVPPMSREDIDRLLAAELRAVGALQSAWPASPSWSELIDMIDGHPRTLRLLARQLGERGTSLEDIVQRLKQHHDAAVVVPELLGQQQAFDALPDRQKARLRSLVASMDLSYEVLAARHPDAVQAFRALSLFPGGVPHSVAQEVTGGIGSMGLHHLIRFNLVEWHDERTFYPVPLHWYAERKRREHPVDEPAIRLAALAAFADFVEVCNERIMTGSIAAGVSRLLREEQTLRDLAVWAGQHGETGLKRSATAKIASGSQNALVLAHLHDTHDLLTREGLRCARALDDRDGEANCLQSLGVLSMHVDDREGAHKAYDTALPIFREIRNRLGEANCLQNLGILLMHVNDLEGAHKAYDTALPIFREIRSRLGEANCLQSLGDLLIRVDDLDGARTAYNTALTTYREIRSRLGEANCLQSLGNLSRRVSDLEDARKAYNTALPIYSEIRDRFGEASCLQNLGELLIRVSDLEGARAVYNTALPIFREIRNRRGEANCLRSLGDLLIRVDDLEGARKAYNTALPIYSEIHEQIGEANCLRNLGDLLIRVDDLEGARTAYNTALPIFREIRNRSDEANCLQSLGLLALRSAQPVEAFQHFINVLRQCENLEDQRGQISAHGYLALAAAAAGAMDQALLLAQASANIGRRIQDRFAQRITLDFQLVIFQWRDDVASFLSTAIVLRSLCAELGEAEQVRQLTDILERVQQGMPKGARSVIEQSPEVIRNAAFAAAEARLAEKGRGLYDPIG